MTEYHIREWTVLCMAPLRSDRMILPLSERQLPLCMVPRPPPAVPPSASVYTQEGYKRLPVIR